MSVLQFSIRIPPELEKRINEYAQENRTTKTRVMIDALAYYLGSVDDVPLSRKVSQLETKVEEIQALVNKHIANN
ncbi:hypothetical protein [Calothrix rhizosoleniae]|uniref:hypothetical protein n=1 Tax=Calothrix rhizosoleniae TaxID=888997 RepID=UPI000B49ADE0|nr:hypothetical protein [Calothrix rhizosoleniae]